jgi:hypothetical protein
MTTTSASRANDIPNAVRETLDSVVSPSVRDVILTSALSTARLAEVPRTPGEFESFLGGPLSAAIVHSLGEEFGHAVTSELERIAALAKNSLPPAESGTRDPLREKGDARTTMRSRYLLEDELPPSPVRTPVARQVLVPLDGKKLSDEQRRAPTDPAPPPALPDSTEYPAGTAQALGVMGTVSVHPSSQARPVVFIASTDTDLLRCFEAWLQMRATVYPAPGIVPLLQELELASQRRVVILLDCRNPSIRPITLAAIAEELKPSTTVLLWGATATLTARLRAVTPLADRFLCFEGSATTNELVAKCVALVS